MRRFLPGAFSGVEGAAGLRSPLISRAFLRIGLRDGALGREGREERVVGGAGLCSSIT